MSSEQIKSMIKTSINEAISALLSRTGYKVSFNNLNFLENTFIPLLSESLQKGDYKRIKDVELMFQIFLLAKTSVDNITENYFFTFSVFLEKQHKVLTARFAKPFIFSLPFTKPIHTLRIVIEFNKSPKKSEIVKLLNQNNISYYSPPSDWIEIKSVLEDVEVSKIQGANDD
jgi:hypothetical protein